MSFAQGFTLLELLVVVTIVAILASIAIPTYDRYMVKARVANMLSVAQAYKIKLVEELMTGSATAAEYDLDTEEISQIRISSLNSDPQKYVIQLEAKMHTDQQNGIGIKQPQNAAKPLIIQLQGINIGELITWTCHVPYEYNDYVPGNCKNNDLEELHLAA